MHDDKSMCPTCNWYGSGPHKKGCPLFEKPPLSADKQHKVDRVTAIASQLIASRVEKGELDGADEKLMEKAIKQAVREAARVYDAALEYVSG
jgi:hypothetical protein